MKEYLLNLYKLYLYALQERLEYGTKYGDTDELIEMYEEELESNGIKVRSRRKSDEE